MKTNFALALAGTGLLALSTSAAFAQQAAAQPEAADAAKADEIIVTARRSAENIQSVPVSISAFNAETLREASIKDTQDLQFSVPGVYLTGASTKDNAAYSIRGQGRAVAGPGQPAVIAYFAEVPLVTLGSGSLTYDLSSVQVLKGPQGTLFGRNTTGGAVLLYPQAPTDKFEGYAQATYGNHDFRDLEAAINVPLVDDLAALRIAGRLSRRDGYTRNVGNGARLDDIHSDQVRGSLTLTPAAGITNLTTIDYRATNQAGNAPILVALTPTAAIIPIAPGVSLADLLAPDLAAQQARGPRKVDYGNFRTRNDIRQLTVVNRTEAEIGDAVTLVNIFGYQSLTFKYLMNTDALPEPIGLLDVRNDFDVRQYTDELQVKGHLADEKLEWLVGGFYYRSEPGGVNGGDFDQFFGFLPGQYTYQYLTENSRALFANISYRLDTLADGLKFNAGVRYTWDRYAACGGAGEFTPPYTVGPDECSATNPVFSPGTAADLRTKSSAPTWTVGLDWQVNQDLFVYATSRRGYRGGGINFPVLGPRLTGSQFFKPEKLTDLELGMRSEWHAGGMKGRFNLSGYVARAKNVQYALTGLSTQGGCAVGNPVFGQPPISPDGDCDAGNDPASSILLANIGDTNIKGLEGEVTIWPAKGLRIGFAGSLLSQSTHRFDLSPNLAFYAGALNGKIPLNYAPKKSGNAHLRYELPIDSALGKVAFNASIFMTGPVDMIAYRAKGYSLTDLRLDWNGIAGSSIDAGLFVKNVFDKDAVTSGGLNAAGAPLISVVYNEPRMFGAQLRVRFGQ